MKKITDLLNRFKNLSPPDESIKKALTSSIKSILNLDMDTKEIYFAEKTGYVFIKTDSIKKTAIFLKKEEIIRETNGALNKNLIKDIK